MDYPFLQPFARAPYPCYWLAADGSFWTNEVAQESDRLPFRIDTVYRMLTALAENGQGEASFPAQPWLGGAVQLGGLSILPLEGGLLAAATGVFEPPVFTIGSQLREPITNIFAILPLLAKRLEDADTRYLDEIQRNSYALLRLTANLECAGAVKDHALELAPIDLAAEMRSLVEGVCMVCGEQGIPIELDLPETPQPVMGEARYLSEAVLNLIRNSMQYTRDGNHIRVAVRTTGQRVVLTVEDAGLGIKPENLGRVFEPYFSADPYADGAPSPGLGLGLSVAQDIIRCHGGVLTCESAFGEGSRFTVALPRAEGNEETPLGGGAADYLLNRYSPIYIQLAGFCRLPGV